MACILGTPGICQPDHQKNGRRSYRQPPNMEKVENLAPATLGTSGYIFHFRLEASDRLEKICWYGIGGSVF